MNTTDLVRSGLPGTAEGPSYSELEEQLEAALLVINAAGAAAEARSVARWDNENALEWASVMSDVFEQTLADYLADHPAPPALASARVLAAAEEEIEATLAYAERHTSGDARKEINRLTAELGVAYAQVCTRRSAESIEQFLAISKEGLKAAWSGMWAAKKTNNSLPPDFRRLHGSAQEQIRIVTLLQAEREN